MQRRNVDLPEPGRAEQAAHLAGLDREVDALQDLELAEALVHALGEDHRARHRRWPSRIRLAPEQPLQGSAGSDRDEPRAKRRSR